MKSGRGSATACQTQELIVVGLGQMTRKMGLIHQLHYVHRSDDKLCNNNVNMSAFIKISVIVR